MRGHGRRGGRVLRAAACVVVLAFAACDDNLFSDDPVAQEPPRITALVAPDSVNAGEPVPVQVAATSRRGVTAIEVRFTGAGADTVTLAYPGDQDVVTGTATLNAFGPVDSLLFVAAVARDVGGRTSAAVRDTVRIRGFIAPGMARSRD